MSYLQQITFSDQYHQPDDLIGEVNLIDDMCGSIDTYPGSPDMQTYNIVLYSGDNKTYRVYLRDRNLNPIDVSGGLGVFTMKKYKTDTVPVVQKHTNVPAQGALGATDMGEMMFYLLPADTQSLEERQYVFDVRFKSGSARSFTTLDGCINLVRPVNEESL